MEDKTIWKIIDTYFQDNPQALVNHHVDSYNDFYQKGIHQIFKDKNPISLYSRQDASTNEFQSECKLYLGGKDGSKIYFGKPVIHDNNDAHFMFPNEARLRNMNYSMTIHYDVEVEFIDKFKPGELPTSLKGGATDHVELETEAIMKGGAPKPTPKKKENKEKEQSEENIELTTKQAEDLREALENG